MTIELEGNWTAGRAFDVHTLSSTYLGPNEFGHGQWENVRSEMGDLVYQLKYRQDSAALPKIVALLDKIKGIEQFDYIIPIPPTDKSRPFQPVTEIALALGKNRGVGVITDYLAKNPGGQQLKNVTDPEEREKLLQESLCIEGKVSLAGRKILLVDDLYRSGANLRVATELLLKKSACGKSVCLDHDENAEQPMTKTVFLSGSRKISRLNEGIRNRLKNIIDQNFRVLIGDANGADKALQSFLADHHYENVIVFCAGSVCRNNIGEWSVTNIPVDPKLKGRDFYAQKDKAMASEADYGFVLWDGKSAGSIGNVLELMRGGKPVVVYFGPEKTFYNLKQAADVQTLLARIMQPMLADVA